MAVHEIVIISLNAALKNCTTKIYKLIVCEIVVSLFFPEPLHELVVLEIRSEAGQIVETVGGQQLARVPVQDDVNEELLGARVVFRCRRPTERSEPRATLTSRQ